MPNSVFVTPILDTKSLAPPLLQLMEKKKVLRGRILKQKQSIKRTIEQTLHDYMDETKRTLHQLSTTITASKKLWKSKPDNPHNKTDNRNTRSRLGCIEEN